MFLTHNPLQRQYLKQQATAEIYRLYANTHERRGKAEDQKRREERGVNQTYIYGENGRPSPTKVILTVGDNLIEINRTRTHGSKE